MRVSSERNQETVPVNKNVEINKNNYWWRKKRKWPLFAYAPPPPSTQYGRKSNRKVTITAMIETTTPIKRRVAGLSFCS